MNFNERYSARSFLNEVSSGIILLCGTRKNRARGSAWNVRCGLKIRIVRDRARPCETLTGIHNI